MVRKKRFKLSVLIPTLPARLDTYVGLVNNLRNQILTNKLEEDVEILSLMDCKSMSVGCKRNLLIEMASGDYVVFIDDDDTVPPYYLMTILNAMTDYPDCIGIKGIIRSEDFSGELMFIHSVQYAKDTPVSDKVMGRVPNHLNPIKRSIASEVKFPDITYAEDKVWAENLYSKLKTETLADPIMYMYLAYGSKSQTSPGCSLSHI